MPEEQAMRQLIRKLIQLEVEQDLAITIVSILSEGEENQTMENCQRMSQELEMITNPSRTWLLGKAILIAD